MFYLCHVMWSILHAELKIIHQGSEIVDFTRLIANIINVIIEMKKSDVFLEVEIDVSN